jgi:hypothetical protein
MENVFCSLYAQSSVDPDKEKRALQELLMHLGQEAAQQQIERHSSSLRLDGLICQALEAASEHADLSADELERLCRKMAGESGRKLPPNRFELVHLGERFLHRCSNSGLNTLIYGGLKGIAEYGMILSGGSMPDAIGIPEEMLREASSLAVCKINIDSDLRLAMTAGIRKHFAEHPDHFDPRQYLGEARDEIQKVVEHKLTHVLGCAGRLAD